MIKCNDVITVATDWLTAFTLHQIQPVLNKPNSQPRTNETSRLLYQASHIKGPKIKFALSRILLRRNLKNVKSFFLNGLQNKVCSIQFDR